MRVIGALSTKDNLCKYCQKEIATCPKANHIKFGNGIGNDNIIECSEFTAKRYFNNYPIVGRPELGVIKRAKSMEEQLACHCGEEISKEEYEEYNGECQRCNFAAGGHC